MAPKDDQQTQETENAEASGVMLDMSQADVKKMVAQAKAKGYITYDELNRVLPQDQYASEQIEDVMSMLSEMGVNVVENDGDSEGEDAEKKEESTEVTKTEEKKTEVDRTDDPVRMYLREMGTVELLSREGEIAIAKRIEAGRATMIGGLCESPLTFQAITIWRDELLEEKILLRDVIDLETTFGQASENDELTPVTPGEPLGEDPAGATAAPAAAAPTDAAPAQAAEAAAADPDAEEGDAAEPGSEEAITE
ncbi:MAG: RNA polymerase sigma factor region1.1 domain-containing protein, partial [Pseudomonadota bacterium]